MLTRSGKTFKEEIPPMTIQRIVCFTFKPETDAAAIQQHMADFAGMKERIPQIQEYHGGLTKPGDFNRPPDYDVMHYLIFASMEDIEVYIPHEAHQRFIERNKAAWDKVLVLNAEIE
jgi:hypothetical protein